MSSKDEARRISGALIDPRVIDPRQELVRHDDLADDELQQIIGVLDAGSGSTSSRAPPSSSTRPT